MLLYYARWTFNPLNGSGKGNKIRKNDSTIDAVVLCSSSYNAHETLVYLFNRKFLNTDIDFQDGDIFIERKKIDSRGFIANWLMLDEFKEPFNLCNVNSNLLRFHSIFK